MHLKQIQSALYSEYRDNGYEDMWNEARAILKKHGKKGMEFIVDLAELGLIVTEVSEAMEDYRNGNVDHAQVECADVIIRTLNHMTSKGANAETIIMKKDAHNRGRGKLHGRLV